MFKEKIEEKLSEKRREDIERRHCVYNADNEIFSNKDDDEEEEEFTDEEFEENEENDEDKEYCESRSEDDGDKVKDETKNSRIRRIKRKNSSQG